MSNAYDESQSPNEGGVSDKHDEPTSPNEGPCLRCVVNWNRQTRGCVYDIG